MVIRNTAFAEMTIKQRIQQKRLPASADTGNYLNLAVLLSVNQLLQIIISLNLHIDPAFQKRFLHICTLFTNRIAQWEEKRKPLWKRFLHILTLFYSKKSAILAYSLHNHTG